MKLVELKPTHATWLLLGVSLGLHLLIPVGYRGEFALPVAAVVTAALGFGLMMWSWSLFERSHNPIRPVDRATVLLTSGPFRFSRNPMYIGMLLMLAGVGLWFGSLPMLIAPVGFLVLAAAVYVPHEERQLRDAFGTAYEAYARKTRRWV